MRMYNKKFKDVFMKIIQHYMVLLLKKKKKQKQIKLQNILSKENVFSAFKHSYISIAA